ncbi:MAG: helix-turn-helix domain-containing protein [Gemmatimonadaceae bacterium]|nr:helix-turn-helix domain-containing protein [Gemmatimonadaceae bacterium]
MAVHRQQWDGGWWEVEQALPDARLREHVVGAYVAWREQSVAPTVRRECAAAIVPLIVNFDAAYTIASPAHPTAQRASFTAGVYDTWVDVTGATSADAVQVNLTPLAAQRVLGIPMARLANQSCGIDDALGASGRAFTEHLGNAATFAERVRLIDAFLLARLARTPVTARAVQQAYRTLVETRGQVRIEQLQHDTGWSAARLGAAMREATGFTPKRLAGILRFEHAVQLARRPGAPSWSHIAAACGYADHAHLTRAFHRYAGEAPSTWARRVSIALPNAER